MPCCAEVHGVGPAIPCGALGGGLQVQHQVDIGPIKLMVTNNGMDTSTCGAPLLVVHHSGSRVHHIQRMPQDRRAAASMYQAYLAWVLCTAACCKPYASALITFPRGERAPVIQQETL